MAIDNLFIGKSKLVPMNDGSSGRFIQFEGEDFYEIKGYDSMLPFFVSIASDSNLWMYISSTGGLTAGRISPDNAIFPYYTDDKIHDYSETTGSKTILHVLRGGNRYLWEPFSNRYSGAYSIERTILKNVTGNKIIFQELNKDLGLIFCYSWMNADDLGWIKKSWIVNESENDAEIRIIDGLQNILPYGVNEFTQSKFSTLVDAYKKSELIGDSTLALYRMESLMADRAEPSEALRVTTVWSCGIDASMFLLSSRQLDQFRNGKSLVSEPETKGVRGAYFIYKEFHLMPSQKNAWYFVVDINKDSAQVVNLLDFIGKAQDLCKIIEEKVEISTDSLRQMVGASDGIQDTADDNVKARHFANVLFNVMRGGIFSDGYSINSSDFSKHINHFNIKLWKQYSGLLSQLPTTLEYNDLEVIIKKQDNPDLLRLFYEYLPLTFSRRHGDPSRPWNAFNIKVKDQNGNKLLAYQGNWRDIFQNWEALLLSYPGYIDGVIAKFLNASTADGYNPYRITNEGIDWEVIEPENPWSNIGYWGDHQIIYLLRLLELSEKYFPGKLDAWLDSRLFAFANVPYRIKPYNDIVDNPKATVVFDSQLNKKIEGLVPIHGADAKLILDSKGHIFHVGLTEKLLVTLLTKLSNFIPEAGIWMNTLRPEWNDANNALVGHGTSMVTLYHIRRYVIFLKELYSKTPNTKFSVTTEVEIFYSDIKNTFHDFSYSVNGGFNDVLRRQMTDKLGIAGENYRAKIYSGFSGDFRSLERESLLDFLNLVIQHIDHTIDANKRPDNMYHSYNLVKFGSDSISIRYLYEMLEGQVAILNSLKLDAAETVELLNSLRHSALYRPDQESYILYPNKKLPNFLQKNNISNDDVMGNPLLKRLSDLGNSSIIVKDKQSHFHFNANFINAEHLKAALLKIKSEVSISVTDTEIEGVLNLYEMLFDHQSFTGRSGTFYKYEGLGSIYWHMVSKLLLSIGESIYRAKQQNADDTLIEQLISSYYEVKKGIGAHKQPSQYGSFPFDPYSHTPLMAGVQQPGMTGQVKEDIISRFIELGVSVIDGQLSFRPLFLNANEHLQPNHEVNCPNLIFTLCGVKINYLKDGSAGIEVIFNDGSIERCENYILSVDISKSVFYREGRIEKIIVHY